ncbi:hypothetical protein KC334_g14670 [Hortaea werneckii]|nr:hypothetical protein KC334_g14670 [Hortaea werneckii]
MHHVKVFVHFQGPDASAAGDSSLANKLMKLQYIAANHVLYSFAAFMSTNETGPCVCETLSFSGIADETSQGLLEKMRSYDVAQDVTVKLVDCEKLLSTWQNVREGLEQCEDERPYPELWDVDGLFAMAWNLRQFLEWDEYMDIAWDHNLTTSTTALSEAIERIRGFVRARLERKAAKMQRLAGLLS